MRISITGLAAAIGLAGCMQSDMPEPSDGRVLYERNCAVCHGPLGVGNGPAAEGLGATPANLTRIALRNGGSFPRTEVLSAIDGYARSGAGAPGMPEFGDLLRGDLIPYDSGDGIETPTPRKLIALLEYLEAIQLMR